MAYASWSVVFGEQPSAAKWNIIGSNASDANSRIATIEAAAYPPTGSIISYAGSTAPSSWLICDGSAISRTTYSALFAVTSTTYGSGNGSTTFNIPDFKGRIPVGKNTGTFVTLGATGGAETHTLTSAQMPVHSHSVTDPGHAHSVTLNYNSEGSGANAAVFEDANPGVVGPVGFNTAAAGTGISIQNAGSGSSHNIIQPYQVINYIIRT